MLIYRCVRFISLYDNNIRSRAAGLCGSAAWVSMVRLSGAAWMITSRVSGAGPGRGTLQDVRYVNHKMTFSAVTYSEK